MPAPQSARFPLARRLLYGGAALLFTRVVGAFGLLAASAILARLITPDELGWYLLLHGVVVIAAVVFSLGLAQFSMREIGALRSAPDAGTTVPVEIRRVLGILLWPLIFVIIASLLWSPILCLWKNTRYSVDIFSVY